MADITFTNTKVFLKSPPDGLPKEDNFEVIKEQETFNLNDGEILIETLYISFDGSQRIWLSDFKLFYAAQIKPGSQMTGRGMGKVIKSCSGQFKEGDIVSGTLFWANYGVYPAESFSSIIDHPLKDHYMSWHTIFTAYFGLTKIGELNKGIPRKCLVSGAGGATGSTALQLLKAWGHDVVGITGSEEKCQKITNLFAIPCINYKRNSENFKLQNEILKYFPKGPEIYFDNVGGEMLDMIMGIMKDFGTIISCGAVSTYDKNMTAEYKNIGAIILKRLKFQGFVVYDYIAEYQDALDEFQKLIKQKKFSFIEDLQEGSISLCPSLMNTFYKGGNFGKFYLKIKENI